MTAIHEDLKSLIDAHRSPEAVKTWQSEVEAAFYCYLYGPCEQCRQPHRIGEQDAD